PVHDPPRTPFMHAVRRGRPQRAVQGNGPWNDLLVARSRSPGHITGPYSAVDPHVEVSGLHAAASLAAPGGAPPQSGRIARWLMGSRCSNVAAHGLPAARAPRSSNGRRAASARGHEAAGAARGSAVEREPGGGARPAGRRAVGGDPARDGG